MAGLVHAIGFDLDEKALQTYRKNIGPGYKADLLSEDGRAQAVAMCKAMRVDCVVGGPPCQGFSGQNLNKDAEYRLGRNSLAVEWAEMVLALSPKAIVMEEVPLFKHASEFRSLVRKLSRHYVLQDEVLCAADYGVPQLRKRLILVGIRRNLPASSCPRFLPLPTTLTHVPSGAAIRGVKMGRKITAGAALDGIKRRQRHRRIPSSWRYMYKCMDLTRPCFTLTTGCGKPSGGAYTIKKRDGYYRMSHQQCAALQSFPRTYKWRGGGAHANCIYSQIGNSVPPLLAKSVGAELLDAMQHKPPPGEVRECRNRGGGRYALRPL
jgi:site-specific DNA-cytosine methylase